jgi:hypothetical protein
LTLATPGAAGDNHGEAAPVINHPERAGNIRGDATRFATRHRPYGGVWMEPSHLAATAEDPREVVARIEQKALRLSALLREIDNQPIELAGQIRSQLDDVLEMLACRVAATRALLNRPQGLTSGVESAA